MKLRTTVIVSVAIGMVAMIQTAQATLTTDTLADLMANNGSLTYGDKTFSDFDIASVSGLTSFSAANIQVTASEAGGIYYLTWSGNISLFSSSAGTADIALTYSVTASAGSIYMIDQSYTGGGIVNIAETVSTSPGGVPVVGSSNLNEYDLSDPPAESNDNLNIVPPETTLYVRKDIVLASDSSLASVSFVTQSFHQVPEPTTMIAGALLLLPFGASTLRILRRNRMY